MVRFAGFLDKRATFCQDVCMRKQNHVTNEEFGAEIGVSFTMASKIRSGSRRPSIKVMSQISQKYHLPLIELVEAHAKGGTEVAKYLHEHLFDIEAATLV